MVVRAGCGIIVISALHLDSQRWPTAESASKVERGSKRWFRHEDTDKRLSNCSSLSDEDSNRALSVMELENIDMNCPVRRL